MQCREQKCIIQTWTGAQYVAPNATESEAKTMARSQHVTPRGEKWQVKGAGNSRATVITSTQKEAIQVATKIAKNQGSELFIHNRQGQIRERNSYGNDPCPPKG